MDAITYTHARSHLAETMEKVCDDHAPVIITRKNERSVVMISLEDYQALEETAYLLRSPKNARRLLESIAELEAGRGTERELLGCSSFSPSTPGTIICIGNAPIGKSSNASIGLSERANAHRLRVLGSPSR
jgi:antitoxin YefM